jgi:hypothetical protein
MNLLMVDSTTKSETQVDLSNDEDVQRLKKEGKEKQAILQVEETKRKILAYYDEIMAKLGQTEP